MAYQVLARKYRPQRFSDVVGQDHVTRTLLNALSQNRIAHGYIFSGHRGIGKTTIARILASALNCRNTIGTEIRPTPEPCNACDSCLEIRQGNAVDVIEIDAATNRGIDEIRELRDAARYRPSRDRFKIYILDEAHQITDAAFNALLKTLEEPPDHIVFMMATTQPEDIPQTIRSRCQHFSFHAVKLEDIVGQLRKISIDEGILADDATLSLLAEAGDGSMRDALSIMDQAIASAPLVDSKPHVALEQVRELMGTVSNVVYEQILEAVHANNSADVLAIMARLLDVGNGPSQLARQFVRYLRNTTVAKITGLTPDTPATGIAADLLQISPEERARAARSAALFTEEELSRFLAIMIRTFDELGYRQEQRFHLELGLLKLVHVQRLVPIEELLTQLGPAPASRPVTTPSGISSAASIPVSAASIPVSAPSPKTPAAPAPQKPPATTPTASTPASVTTIKQETASWEKTAPTPGSISAAPSFESDFNRKTPVATAATAIEPSAPVTTGSMALAPEPAPLPAVPAPVPAERPQLVPERPQLVTTPAVIETVAETEEIPAPASQAPVESGPDTSPIQSAMVALLTETKGQQSASDAVDDATFTLTADTLTIQTTLSKPMLPVVINGEAERLLKGILREHNPALKLQILPGTPSNNKAKKPRAAAAGSVAELAEKHPVVQQARELFNAEISNVIDLRKD